MAGQVPDVYSKFIADTTEFLAPVLKSVEAVVQLSRALTDVDAALAGFRDAAASAAGATTAAADGAKAAADAQVALGDAAKAATDGAIAEADADKVLLDILGTMVGAERAAAEASVALADAEKATAAAAKLAGDAQLATAAKTKTAAEESSILSGVLGKAGGAMSSFGGMAAGAAKKGMEGFAAATVYSIYEAQKFGAEITRLYTAANLTGVSFQKVSQDALDLGNKWGYTGTQIALAMYHAESAGLDYKTSLTLVANAAQLANIHGAKLEDTTYGLSSVMKAFNLSEKDTTQTAALLNAIVGQGDMRFQQFNASVKNWAPTAASMGISIQSLGAAISYLTDRGNSAEVAATRLTMGLSMMTSGSKQANAYLHELGLTADFATAKNQTLADMMTHAGLTTNKLAADLKKPDGVFVALKDLQDAFRKAGLSAAESDQLMAKIFGGGRSDKAIMSLMQNLDGVKQKFDGIGGAVKNFGANSAQAMQTPEQQFKNLLATVQNLAIQFGNAMLPAVTALSSGLSKMFADPAFVAGMQQFGTYLGEVLKQATPLVPVIMKLGSELMKALGPVLPILAQAVVRLAQALGDQLAKVLQQLAPHLPALARSLGDLAVALIPLIPSIAKLLEALIPLVPAFTKVVEVVALSTAAYAQAAAAIVGILAPVIKWLAQATGWLVKILYEAWKWLYDVLIGHSIIPDLVNGMISWFTKGVNEVKRILSWFEGLPGMFSRWMTGMVDAVSRGFSQVLGLAQNLPGRILGALGNLGSLLYNAGQSVIQGLISGIQSMLGSLWSLVGSIGSSISNLKGPISKDLVLLVPHGQALMAGLQAGIEQGLVGVHYTVAQIAPTIAGHHGHGHHPRPSHHHPHLPPGLGSMAAGIGYTSGVGALAYGAGGTIINNNTVVQVQGSVLSDRDLMRVVQKGLSKHSSVNSTNGTTVPAGRTG